MGLIMKSYPIKLMAPCKDYIWGGTRLKTEYGKVSDKATIAESWELSCHKDGESVISNGEYQGMTLSQYIDKAGRSILGINCERFEYFPILIKLIDARDNLSVQVHPDNEYALRTENEYGKTEMWYIVDCEPNAELLYGFKNSISKEEFKTRIENNTLTEVANNVKVEKGDVFFIEAGTLHAIGKGILIAEIQQNSNTTYRIYDYGRMGADGKPRELHIKKALEVTELMPPKYGTKSIGEPIRKDGYTETLLSTSEYFNVSRLEIDEKAELICDDMSFNSLLILSGEGEIDGVKLKKGESCFVPAGYGKYVLKGKAEVIFTKII